MWSVWAEGRSRNDGGGLVLVPPKSSQQTQLTMIGLLGVCGIRIENENVFYPSSVRLFNYWLGR